MANLMITTACNFRCEYCFGRDIIGPTHPAVNMSWKMFIDLVDWVQSGNIPSMDIHLMGGEPSLHPQFGDMIDELIKREINISVFSNASTPLSSSIIEKSRKYNVQWVVNANHPDFYTEDQMQNLKKNLFSLGDSAYLTFNICGSETPYDYVFDYISKYSLSRKIKIGISLPTMEKNNSYVSFDRFSEISEYVMILHEKAVNEKIEIEFECGVPFCLFSNEQRELLKNIHISHCGSRLDITPWGEVINCLPLARFASFDYKEFRTYRDARDWFFRTVNNYRSVGVEDRCFGCSNIPNGNCGVCLAHGLDKYSSVPFERMKSDGRGL